MKTLILILLVLFVVSCGEEPGTTTIYKYKYVYAECMEDVEESCQEHTCTEEQKEKLIEDFCLVEE